MHYFGIYHCPIYSMTVNIIYFPSALVNLFFHKIFNIFQCIITDSSEHSSVFGQAFSFFKSFAFLETYPHWFHLVPRYVFDWFLLKLRLSINELGKFNNKTFFSEESNDKIDFFARKSLPDNFWYS